MRSINRYTLALTVLIFASCKKDHSPTPPTPPIKETIHLNYIYMASSYALRQDSSKQMEVILSEPGGAILLDTIAKVNTPLVADIKTSRKLVDLSVIRYSPAAQAFYINIEKAISPGDWSVLPGSDSALNSPSNIPPTYASASVYYTHVPVPALEPFLYGDYTGASNTAYSDYGDHGLVANYLKLPDQDVYLSFPKKGLYNFHHLTSLKDTVDLSKMDTAAKAELHNVPAQYPNVNFALLIGFTDPANTAKKLFLSNYNYTPGDPTNVLISYPIKNSPFRKYFESVQVMNSTGKIFSGYVDPWADTVTSYPIFLDDSYFNLSSTDNNNFSIRFNKTAPGYYTTYWFSGRLGLTIDAPSDTTSLHVVDYVKSLKSQLLKNEDLTSVNLNYFNFNYQVKQGMQLVPINLTPVSNLYHDPYSSSQSAQVSYNRQF